MRATPDWEADPDAASVAKFRRDNRGAPQLLIVSSSDDEGSAFARKLGYGDCKARRFGARELNVCKVPTRLSAAHD